MAPPKYLTGDKAAINEFIDKFDVRHFPWHMRHTNNPPPPWPGSSPTLS